MSTTTSISFDLGPGERLLWSGEPQQGVVFRRGDLLAVPFSVLWGGFAIFWESMALRRSPYAFALFGVPFVAIGLYIMIGRFYYDAYVRKRTSYGITTSRLIIAGGPWRSTVRSISLDTLTNLELNELGNDRGTITFGSTFARSRWQGQSSWPGTPSTPAFDLIANAKQVFDLIGEARRAALPAGAAAPAARLH